ncbi:hypothetical protein [Candidatus Poriferisocius sp.]|uniref:hypothetical protein n=1 Tax=Candidatus Poriferisocius sp. TaxID=3101276 RepID=UPI003B5A30C4
MEETDKTTAAKKDERPNAAVASQDTSTDTFWNRFGKLIRVPPGTDIDSMGVSVWAPDWCPTHEAPAQHTNLSRGLDPRAYREELDRIVDPTM